MTRLYLKKNDKNILKNKELGEEKLPYFSLVVPPEEGEDPKIWKEVAAFWKSKKGNGYNGKLANGVTVTFGERQSLSD